MNDTDSHIHMYTLKTHRLYGVIINPLYFYDDEKHITYNFPSFFHYKLNVINIYRAFHLTTEECLCFSSASGMFTKIHHILCYN